MKIALTIAILSVLGAVFTFLHTVDPAVTVQFPEIVYTETPCGQALNGCYREERPNEIQVRPDASLATINHETLHFVSNRDNLGWSECQVSYINLTRYGLEDTYHRAGYCVEGQPTLDSPAHVH